MARSTDLLPPDLEQQWGIGDHVIDEQQSNFTSLGSGKRQSNADRVSADVSEVLLIDSLFEERLRNEYEPLSSIIGWKRLSYLQTASLTIIYPLLWLLDINFLRSKPWLQSSLIHYTRTVASLFVGISLAQVIIALVAFVDLFAEKHFGGKNSDSSSSELNRREDTTELLISDVHRSVIFSVYFAVSVVCSLVLLNYLKGYDSISIEHCDGDTGIGVVESSNDYLSGDEEHNRDATNTAAIAVDPEKEPFMPTPKEQPRRMIKVRRIANERHFEFAHACATYVSAYSLCYFLVHMQTQFYSANLSKAWMFALVVFCIAVSSMLLFALFESVKLCCDHSGSSREGSMNCQCDCTRPLLSIFQRTSNDISHGHVLNRAMSQARLHDGTQPALSVIGSSLRKDRNHYPYYNNSNSIGGAASSSSSSHSSGPNGTGYSSLISSKQGPSVALIAADPTVHGNNGLIRDELSKQAANPRHPHDQHDLPHLITILNHMNAEVWHTALGLIITECVLFLVTNQFINILGYFGGKENRRKREEIDHSFWVMLAFGVGLLVMTSLIEGCIQVRCKNVCFANYLRRRSDALILAEMSVDGANGVPRFREEGYPAEKEGCFQSMLDGILLFILISTNNVSRFWRSCLAATIGWALVTPGLSDRSSLSGQIATQLGTALSSTFVFLLLGSILSDYRRRLQQGITMELRELDEAMALAEAHDQQVHGAYPERDSSSKTHAYGVSDDDEDMGGQVMMVGQIDYEREQSALLSRVTMFDEMHSTFELSMAVAVSFVWEDLADSLIALCYGKRGSVGYLIADGVYALCICAVFVCLGFVLSDLLAFRMAEHRDNERRRRIRAQARRKQDFSQHASQAFYYSDGYGATMNDGHF